MKRIWLLLCLGWTAYAQPPRVDGVTPFQRLILAQCASYPSIGIQDLYKFAFQAAMGNEHFMTDTASLLKYLTDEMSSLSPGDPSEPFLEYLTPDSDLVRCNLRPFKARNGDPSLLLWAMLSTASTFVASTEQLEKWMGEIRKLARRGKIPFSEPVVSKYFSSVKSRGYPAVHHSPEYEHQYQPAYRVLARRELKALSSSHK